MFLRSCNVLAWMAGTSPAKTVSWRYVTSLALRGRADAERIKLGFGLS
jgi:hypothetical protein